MGVRVDGSRCGLEGALVCKSVVVGEHLHLGLQHFWEPEIGAHKGQVSIHLRVFLIAILDVEEITAPDERLSFAPVAVHAIDCYSVILSIDGDSLVKAFLVWAESFVCESEVLIPTSNNFHSVGVELAHTLDWDLFRVHVLHESPLGWLPPFNAFSEVMFDHYILIGLHSERSHNNCY